MSVKLICGQIIADILKGPLYYITIASSEIWRIFRKKNRYISASVDTTGKAYRILTESLALK